VIFTVRQTYRKFIYTSGVCNGEKSQQCIYAGVTTLPPLPLSELSVFGINCHLKYSLLLLPFFYRMSPMLTKMSSSSMFNVLCFLFVCSFGC